MNRNNITFLTQPLFNDLCKFRIMLDAGEVIAYSTLRKELNDRIDLIINDLKKIPGLYEKIETIEYILVALADDVITFSNWEHAEQWSNHFLEYERCHSTIAGEKFQKLLESEAYKDSEMAELFYMCLGMGFHHTIENTSKIMNELYPLIPEHLSEIDHQITPKDAETTIFKKNYKLPFLFGFWIFIIVIITFSIFYSTASILIWESASQNIHNISNQLITKGY